MALSPPMTDDQAKAWLQDHAIAMWGRLLDVGTENTTWLSYLNNRGYEQTVISLFNGAATASTHPNNPSG